MTGREASLHRPNGTLARDGWACVVDPETAGWAYSGLRVLDLAAGGSISFDTGPDEMLLLPLSGSATVTCGGSAAALDGRPSVRSGPTDFAYLPVGSDVTVSSVDGGRFALPAARASRRRSSWETESARARWSSVIAIGTDECSQASRAVRQGG